MCLYPRMIKNRRYQTNKKNGGNIPPVTDNRVKYVPIGCQDCKECRKQKQRAWQMRLLEDIKTNTNGKFIALTLSNESIKQINAEIPLSYKKIINNKEYEIPLEGYERDNAIATYAIRHFLERWRKKYKRSLRHWLVTELGHKGTENIHLHGIIWSNESMEILEKVWKYGWIWKGKMIKGKLINYVNGQTVNYTVKYISKVDQQHKGWKSKVLTSPGIGRNYTTTHDYKKNAYNGNQTNETYRTQTGHKINLPIYWRNKRYTEQEREQLWIIKLDKQERWVGGERIDISKGEQEYYKMLQWYRERNKELGYGTGQTTWERSQYEIERRAIMLKARVENTYGKDNEKNQQKSTALLKIKPITQSQNNSRLNYKWKD